MIKGLLVKFKRIKNTFKFLMIPDLDAKKVLKDASAHLRIETTHNAKLILDSPCFANEPNCTICVRDNAILEIGHNTFFNRNCIIVAREKISIGANCLFGPNVYICDHDHMFNQDTVFTDQFITRPVSIGEGSWIGAGCIILKGANIGKKCIIGAGSIITGNVPDGMIVVQKKTNTMYERECDVYGDEE